MELYLIVIDIIAHSLKKLWAFYIFGIQGAILAFRVRILIFLNITSLDIDTSEYSFPYIASWSDGKQLEQLKSALQEIQEAAKKISSEIESELLKLQKRNLTMDEKLADTELNNIQKAEFLIEDCADRGVNFSKEDTDKILDFAGNHENISETVQFVTDMEEIQRQRDSYGYRERSDAVHRSV